MMTTPEISPAMVMSLATLVSAVSAGIIGLRNTRKIHDVHVSINSRMDQLLAEARLLAHAQGRAEMHKEDRAYTDSK